jgi:hypothetical protein
MYRKTKVNIKFLLASFETLTNSKDFAESCIRISVLAFLLSHWSLYSSVPDDTAGFLKQFS